MVRVFTTNLFSIILILSAIVIFISCATSDTTRVDVNNSEILPDCEELLIDSLIADGVKICSMAQRYYHKSWALGGGGNSFNNFAIPAKYDTTNHGFFWAPNISELEYHLTGMSLPGLCNNDEHLMIEFIATPDEIVANLLPPVK